MSRRKRSPFKKREFIRILNGVVGLCLENFGYRKRPYLLQTKLEKGEMMVFCRENGKYAIFYDYDQFHRLFWNKDYETQEAYAASFIAHEMRHYYQIRQLESKKPRESEETLESWRKNDEEAKNVGENGCTILDFYMQPMEWDAELYAYVFVAKFLDRAIKLDFIDAHYLHILKNKYIETFGETEDLSFFDVDF